MSNTTYDIPVVAAGVNAPSVSLINDDAEARTFVFASTNTTDRVAIFGSDDGVNFPPITATPLLSMGGNSPPLTLNDRSLQYRAVFTGSGTRTLKVRAGTCCAGGGTVPSEHFVTLPLGNFPAGGVIGTAAATVDQFAAFTINQTSADQTLTLPAPTDATATYVRWISNIGTQSFILYGLIVLPGSGTKLLWNGSAWFNGCVGTSTPLRSVLAAAGKDILDSDGTTTLLGNPETVVAGSSLQLSAGAGGASWAVDGAGAMTLTTVNGTAMLDTQGGAIGIGNSLAFAKAVTVGSLTGAAATTIQAGTTGILIQPAATGPVTLDSGTTGNVDIARGLNAKTITIGNAVGATLIALVCGTGGIGVGDNATDHSTSVGSVIGVSLTSIQFGTAGCHIQGVAGGTIGIGNNVVDHDTVLGSVTGVSLLTLQGGTGGVTLTSTTGAVSIGANAADHATTLGSVTGASLTTVQGGTSGVTIQPAPTGPLTAKSGTSGAATFDSGSTGAVHLGDGGAVKAVTLGSITGASSLAIRAGTGGLSIINNGLTFVWPTAFGAAGSKLTDAAGNGVLSFA